MCSAASPPGFFVSFEGLDGCGKTTQAGLLAEALRAAGHEVVATHQPGGTALGDRIRALLLDSRNTGTAPMAELGLMFSDRAQNLAEVVLPALRAGRVVLTDRFTDSSEAYQGWGRELGGARVLALNDALCGGLQPDLTFLLLSDAATTLARALRRNRRAEVDENRFEREGAAFYARVLAGYRHIAEREPVRVVTLDAHGAIDAIHREIVRTVMERLAAHRERAERTAVENPARG